MPDHLKPHTDLIAHRAGVDEDGRGYSREFRYDPRVQAFVFRRIHDEVARCQYELHVHPHDAFRVYDSHAGGLEIAAVMVLPSLDRDDTARRPSFLGKPLRVFASGWYSRATGRLVRITPTGGGTPFLERDDPGVPMVEGRALEKEPVG